MQGTRHKTDNYVILQGFVAVVIRILAFWDITSWIVVNFRKKVLSHVLMVAELSSDVN
jgi:hypothetical protein